MKKLLGLTLAAASLLTIGSLGASAQENLSLNEQFTYEEGKEITFGGASNYHIYSKHANTAVSIIDTSSEGGDGALRMTQAATVPVGGVYIGSNTTESSLYDGQANSAAIIKVRTRFDQTYRKNITINFATTKYTLFSWNNSSAYYNLGSGNKNTPTVSFAKNQWYDLTFILSDEGALGEDKLYIYLDDKFLCQGLFEAYDFQGTFGRLSFETPNSGNFPLTNWDIDYLTIGEYTKPSSTVELSDKEVTSGEVFEYEPAIQTTAIDTSYTVKMSPADILSYNTANKKFTAGVVSSQTPVSVTFDYNDPFITDITKTVTVKPTSGEIKPQAIEQKLFSGDITLTEGQAFKLNDLFEAVPATATNRNLSFEVASGANFITIANDELTATAGGTATIKVTALGDSSITKIVNVKVVKGNFEDGNNMSLTDKWDTVDVTHNGFESKGYGGKTYAPISVVEDPIFGKAFKFTGVGGENEGASHLDKFYSTSELTANKDYKITGWAKIDFPATATSVTRIDIKAYGYSLVDGNPSFANQAPYTLNLQIQKASLINGWYFFETDTINLDTNKIGNGLDGIKLEIVNYNTEKDVNSYVTNIAFVEQDTVKTTGYEVSVDGTVVTEATTINKSVGDTFNIVTLSIPSAGNVSLTYTSSDTTKATVSATGVVTLLDKSGEVEITVSDGKTSRVVKINISKPVQEITAPQTELEVVVSNRNNSFDFTITPLDATSELKVVVANGDICTATIVGGKLYIVPVSIGNTTVRIVSTDDEAIYLEFKVTVKEGPTTDLTLENESGTIEKGQTISIVATTTPAGKTVTYSSSDETIATVNASGVITALKAGTATITVTSEGISKNYVVTVIVKTTSVSVDKEKVDLKLNETYNINVTVGPIDSTETITYTSSDSKVITVDNNGKVTAVGNGTATVTVTSGSSSVTVTFNVSEPVNVAMIVVPIVVAVALVAAGLAFFFVRKKSK